MNFLTQAEEYEINFVPPEADTSAFSPMFRILVYSTYALIIQHRVRQNERRFFIGGFLEKT